MYNSYCFLRQQWLRFITTEKVFVYLIPVVILFRHAQVCTMLGNKYYALIILYVFTDVLRKINEQIYTA